MHRTCLPCRRLAKRVPCPKTPITRDSIVKMQCYISIDNKVQKIIIKPKTTKKLTTKQCYQLCLGRTCTVCSSQVVLHCIFKKKCILFPNENEKKCTSVPIFNACR